MKINFSNWSVNSKLALLALLLGFIAMFMKDPLKARLVSIDAQDLALKIQDKSANINVEDLANRIIQKKSDYKLIDLRDEAHFKEYNIPTSINLNSNELPNVKFDRSEMIILYSDDNLQAAMGWFLLKAKRFSSVYLLSGGLAEWKDKILFPGLPVNASQEEKDNFAKIVEICKFFGGSPRLGASDSLSSKAPMAMPKVIAPSANSNPKAGKAKREGC